jgi:hypothetical protein
MWPKKLYTKLHAPGPIERANIDDLLQQLATALPPA